MIVPFEIITYGNAEHFSRVDSLENKAIKFNWRMSWRRSLKARLQLLAFGWIQLQAVILRPGTDKIYSLLKCALFGWWYYFRNSGVIGEFPHSKRPIFYMYSAIFFHDQWLKTWRRSVILD